MEKVKLVVQHREAIGSRAARRLRREGRIPGVLYGHGQPAVHLSVEPSALRAALSTGAGTHAVLEVVFEDQKKVHRAIIKEMELDRVKHTVTHVDLEEVRLDQVVESQGRGPLRRHGRGRQDGRHGRRVVARGHGQGPRHRHPRAPRRRHHRPRHRRRRARLRPRPCPRSSRSSTTPSSCSAASSLPRKAEVEEEAEEGLEELLAEEAPAEPEIIGKHKEEEAE